MLRCEHLYESALRLLWYCIPHLRADLGASVGEDCGLGVIDGIGEGGKWGSTKWGDMADIMSDAGNVPFPS